MFIALYSHINCADCFATLMYQVALTKKYKPKYPAYTTTSVTDRTDNAGLNSASRYLCAVSCPCHLLFALSDPEVPSFFSFFCSAHPLRFYNHQHESLQSKRISVKHTCSVLCCCVFVFIATRFGFGLSLVVWCCCWCWWCCCCCACVEEYFPMVLICCHVMDDPNQLFAPSPSLTPTPPPHWTTLVKLPPYRSSSSPIKPCGDYYFLHLHK